MSATFAPSNCSARTADTATPSFADVYVTITKQEHIALKTTAQYWQTMHLKAVSHFQWRELRYQRLMRELKAQSLKSQADLAAQLELAQAQVRDLQRRLFSTKSEQGKHCETRAKAANCHAARGQCRGSAGHGRTLQTQLPSRHEDVTLAKAQCPKCGLAFNSFAGTEDAQVLEVEVKAYRRVIHRHRYRPSCQCGSVSGIITAPAPTRLINRGKFGISVWVSVLLDKFLYGRPSQRLLQDFAEHRLNMSAGTLAGGLQELAPMFKPVNLALQSKLRSEPHWHADETRWAVFVDVQGKVGHRWYLWVFHSSSVVHYVIDQTRARRSDHR